jgi:hypothetical protein
MTYKHLVVSEEIHEQIKDVAETLHLTINQATEQLLMDSLARIPDKKAMLDWWIARLTIHNQHEDESGEQL